MIIKSHIRGGYRAAADYLKDIGQNETTRLVSISDPDAKTLDQAFQNMWAIASASKVKKPLHHISINPMKDERLTDKQVKLIVERCEQKYGYKPGKHQYVIVEHVKDGRQHFHVIWNRVSLESGKAVWPGHHWLKSKQVCREMEVELGLKRPIARHRGKFVAKPYKKLSATRDTELPGATKKPNPVTSRSPRLKSLSVKHGGLVHSPLFIHGPRENQAAEISAPQNRTASSRPIFSVPKLRNLHSAKLPSHVGAALTPPSFGGDVGAKEMLLPQRPTAHGNMSKEQLADFAAACEGRITWRQYFQKWGREGLSM